MVMSDLRVEMEIWHFRACAMHLAIITGRVHHCELGYGQIPHSTECISSFVDNSFVFSTVKKCLKSVDSWQSYCKSPAPHFLKHSVVTDVPQ